MNYMCIYAAVDAFRFFLDNSIIVSKVLEVDLGGEYTETL